MRRRWKGRRGEEGGINLCEFWRGGESLGTPPLCETLHGPLQLQLHLLRQLLLVAVLVQVCTCVCVRHACICYSLVVNL